MKCYEELKYRGLIKDETPGLEELLTKDKTTFYFGVDCTAKSLTVGNLVVITISNILTKHGHECIVVIGDKTSLIGDPSGKNVERPILDVDDVNKNVISITQQIKKLLPKSKVIGNSVNPYTEDTSDFMKEVGKHLTMGEMLNRTSVKSRLETGISYTEFSYMAFQAADYLNLSELYNCNLQIGGSDQWGNITLGMDLIRKKQGVETHGMTCPLLTDHKGNKFGKSEGNAIFLDKDCFSFFQFWMNIPDSDIIDLFKVFYPESPEETESFITAYSDNLSEIRRTLASVMTEEIFDTDKMIISENLTDMLFKGMPLDLISSDSEKDYEICCDSKFRNYKKGVTIKTLMVDLLDISFSESIKLIENNAIKVNDTVFNDPYEPLDDCNWSDNGYIVLSKGKKDRYLIKLTE